jgi:hypothetical protein
VAEIGAVAEVVVVEIILRTNTPSLTYSRGHHQKTSRRTNKSILQFLILHWMHPFIWLCDRYFADTCYNLSITATLTSAAATTVTIRPSITNFMTTRTIMVRTLTIMTLAPHCSMDIL